MNSQRMCARRRTCEPLARRSRVAYGTERAWDHESPQRHALKLARSCARGAAIGFFATLCAASPSLAQSGIDLYGKTEATIGWESADGPVAGYYVIVQRNDGAPTVDGVVVDTRATVSANFGDSVIISVNAFDAGGVPGPTSPPSPEIRFNAEIDGGGPSDPPPPDEEEPPPNENPPTPQAVAADFTGNGTSDLMLQASGRVELWDLDSGDVPRELTVPTISDGWNFVSRGDFDGNASVDLVFEHGSTGANVILLFEGGDIVDGMVPNFEVGAAPWVTVGAGDFDGDGRVELVRQSHELGLLEFVSPSPESTTSSEPFELGSGTIRVVAIDDFDADGLDEILWLDEATQALSLWDLTDNAVESLSVADLGAGWSVFGAGDFDGDGPADLFVHHAEASALEVWRLDGASILETLALPSVSDEVPVDVADYDGDGRSDIALHRKSTGRIVAWLSDGGSNVAESVLLEAEDWSGDAPVDAAARLCAADSSGDGYLGHADFLALAACHGGEPLGACAFADLNGNGRIASSDFEIFKENYGKRVCEAQ